MDGGIDGQGMDKWLGGRMDMCMGRWADWGDAWIGEEREEVVDRWTDGQITGYYYSLYLQIGKPKLSDWPVGC